LRTDILALNASVEAAHAGAAGQRFAVVAGEVGRLATRSAAAAKEISDLISTSITTSKAGQQRLDEVVKVIERITASSGNVKRLVDEVNRGSQDQAYSMSEISRAVNELEKVMNVLASTAQQSAVASREMNEQSVELREIVGELGALSA
jgi:methyl-accepting chemotaxis protein